MADLQGVISESIGEFGLAQFVMVFSLRGGGAILAWGMIMMSYAGITPDWWSFPNERNVTGNESLDKIDIGRYKTCPSSINESIVFDQSFKSIVSQWNLVCERQWIPSLITMLQMIGVFIGASTCGQLGDWLGRKKTTISYLAIAILFTFVSAFPRYWQVMAVCRFFIGLAIGGYLVIHYPYFVEYVGISWRTSMHTIPFWSVGVITFGISMMWVDDWSKLALGSAICGVPLLIWMCFLPESPRWLFAKGRVEEAKDVLRRLARWNRMEEPKFASLDILDSSESHTETYTYITLVRNGSTRYPIIVCSIMWFCCTMIYYGFTFGVGKLSGNPGLNMSLFGLTEIAALGLVWLLSKMLGRRQLGILFFVAAASFSFATFIQYFAARSFFNTRRHIFVIIARFWLSSAWSIATMMIQEVFPTSVRALGHGFAQTVGRIGGIIGSQMQMVHDLHSAAPYAVYGALLVITAVMIYFLEETRDEPLKDLLEDGKANRERKSQVTMSQITITDEI